MYAVGCTNRVVSFSNYFRWIFYRGSTYEDNLKPNQLPGGLGAVTQSRSQPPSLVSNLPSFWKKYAVFGICDSKFGVLTLAIVVPFRANSKYRFARGWERKSMSCRIIGSNTERLQLCEYHTVCSFSTFVASLLFFVFHVRLMQFFYIFIGFDGDLREHRIL